MALLTRAGVQGKRPWTANRLGAWWAVQRQKRRRNALSQIRAPVIVSGGAEWNRSWDGWADVILYFDFDGGYLPAATLEIWWMREWQDVDFGLLTAVPSSDRVFHHVNVTSVSGCADYKMRYRNGSVLGPFCESYMVDI
jgi:hypothetical protein